MAVADKMTSTLRLVLYDGDDLVTGKPIYTSKSFNNIKTSAETDQLYQTAIALSGLQERPLYNIERRDSSEIRES